MRTVQPLPADQLDLGNIQFYNLNQAGDGLVLFEGEGFANVNTTSDVLDSSATVGYVRTGGLPATVTFLEHHNHTAELLLAGDNDMVVLIAPDTPADQPPKAELVRALLVPKGSAVLFPRDAWHSLAFGVHGPSQYFWLSHQIPNPQADTLVDLDEPVHISAAVNGG